MRDETGARGVSTAVDFAAVFARQPTAYLVMSADLVIVEANAAYLELLGRTREELVGRYVFDAFPPAPEALDPDGVNPLQASFERARDTGVPDHMPLFHYEVHDHALGRSVPRAWSLISAPVLDAAGRTQWVLQRVEDVTEFLAERERLAERRDDGGWARLDVLEADLFARTQELRAVLAAQEETARRLAAMAQVVLQSTAAETVADVTDVLAGAGLAAIGADGGGIALRDDERGVVDLTLTPSMGEGAQRRYGTLGLGGRLPAAWAARTGETLVFAGRAEAEAWDPGMREAFEQTGQQAWIVVPLTTAGRLLGSLSAGWREERSFSDAEIELVQAFAAQCAQALDRVQVLTQERRSAERSRRLAEDLQRSMLTEPVQPDHCQTAVRYLPATGTAQVGGDWYDAFRHADGSVDLVIGDVVGHDIGAAATMGQLRSLLRGIAMSGAAGPAQVLDTMDTAIAQLGLATYATVGMGRLERSASGATRLRWASAGHPPPVVLDTDGVPVPVPEAPGRLMLGVDASSTRGESVLDLDDGATVLLYTDGLVERPGSDLDAGVAALREVVAEAADLPLEQLCDRVVDRLVDGRPADDVALVAVRLDRASAGTSGRAPAQYAAAHAGWHSDSPVPAVSGSRLTLELASLRGLSGVRQQLRHFLQSSVEPGPTVEDVVERAVLVVDELASNALRHGAPPASLHIADEETRWIVLVTDSAPGRRPTPARGRREGQGGYGLYVVADLTLDHGVHYAADRKVVWVVLDKQPQLS
ncbi:SpoIIE family protein phosphatase [Modestobacter sp. VKM Ac-2986]|uniref:ATP-binding SpoIIE family protein phosphatase n=1 Tax=Modestobacter sp. VKM Ac-2986 TaxID=3004140 RepID=UPI0022AAE5ED|nr:SpoIIE family protein phosphatase [Modestobacter sp. VKM Ac-2986]MCZ2827442.1 SpoIIE family protein phosphatase [Modestobacter sp. VKM Ac-2986]